MVKKYKKIEKLSEEEIGQIGRYISSDSYKINAKLRGEEELSEFETEYIKKLSGILKKIPTVKNQKLVRDLCFFSESAKNTFLKIFKKGATVYAESFWSTTKSEEYNDMANVRIIIKNANNARDISQYGLKKENKALYEIGSEFKFVSMKKIHRKNGSELCVVNLREM